MKPGGLCSPSDGSSTPSGDGISDVSAACKTLGGGGGGQFPSSSTSEESPACLTPDLFEDQHQGAKAGSSAANGFICGEVTNGLCETLFDANKNVDIPRHVLSPPASEDGEDRTSTNRTSASDPTTKNSSVSALYQGRCNTSESQNRVQPLADTLVGTSECSKPSVHNVFSREGTVFNDDTSETSSHPKPPLAPQNIKSTKYRRRCSLDDLVAKLHKRTDHVVKGSSNIFSILSSSGHSIKPSQGDAATTWLVEKQGEDASSSSCPSDNSQSLVCDNINTAIHDAHPSIESSSEDVQSKCDSYVKMKIYEEHDAHGSPPNDSRTLNDGGKVCSEKIEILPNQSIVIGEHLPSKSTTLEKHLTPCSDLESVNCVKDPESKELISERTSVTERTDSSSCDSSVTNVCSLSKNAQCESVLADGSSSKSENKPVELNAKFKSDESSGTQAFKADSCSTDKEILESDEKYASNDSDLTTDKNIITPVSIIDLVDNDTKDSGSDLEILFEKRRDTSVSNLLHISGDNSNEEIGNTNSERVHKCNMKNEGTINPSTLKSRRGSLQYLEPISEDENSLLCAPSPPSELSSASGFPSSSDTPLFSDTPSDASRGAIMVKISDAVAAILSDVSDDSLPASPSECKKQNSFANLIPRLVETESKCSSSFTGADTSVGSDIAGTGVHEQNPSRFDMALDDKPLGKTTASKASSNPVVQPESNLDDTDKSKTSSCVVTDCKEVLDSSPKKTVPDSVSSQVSEHNLKDSKVESPDDLEVSQDQKTCENSLPPDQSCENSESSLGASVINSRSSSHSGSTLAESVMCTLPSHSSILSTASLSSEPCNTESSCQKPTSGTLHTSSQPINSNRLSDCVPDTNNPNTNVKSSAMLSPQREQASLVPDVNKTDKIPSADDILLRESSSFLHTESILTSPTTLDNQNIEESPSLSNKENISILSFGEGGKEALVEVCKSPVTTNALLVGDTEDTRLSEIREKSELVTPLPQVLIKEMTHSCEEMSSDKMDVTCQSVDDVKHVPAGSVSPASTSIAIHDKGNALSENTFCEGKVNLKSFSPDDTAYAQAASALSEEEMHLHVRDIPSCKSLPVTAISKGGTVSHHHSSDGMPQTDNDTSLKVLGIDQYIQSETDPKVMTSLQDRSLLEVVNVPANHVKTGTTDKTMSVEAPLTKTRHAAEELESSSFTQLGTNIEVSSPKIGSEIHQPSTSFHLDQSILSLATENPTVQQLAQMATETEKNVNSTCQESSCTEIDTRTQNTCKDYENSSRAEEQVKDSSETIVKSQSLNIAVSSPVTSENVSSMKSQDNIQADIDKTEFGLSGMSSVPEGMKGSQEAYMTSETVAVSVKEYSSDQIVETDAKKDTYSDLESEPRTSVTPLRFIRQNLSVEDSVSEVEHVMSGKSQPVTDEPVEMALADVPPDSKASVSSPSTEMAVASVTSKFLPETFGVKTGKGSMGNKDLSGCDSSVAQDHVEDLTDYEKSVAVDDVTTEPVHECIAAKSKIGAILDIPSETVTDNTLHRIPEVDVHKTVDTGGTLESEISKMLGSDTKALQRTDVKNINNDSNTTTDTEAVKKETHTDEHSVVKAEFHRTTNLAYTDISKTNLAEVDTVGESSLGRSDFVVSETEVVQIVDDIITKASSADTISSETDAAVAELYPETLAAKTYTVDVSEKSVSEMEVEERKSDTCLIDKDEIGHSTDSTPSEVKSKTLFDMPVKDTFTGITGNETGMFRSNDSHNSETSVAFNTSDEFVGAETTKAAAELLLNKEPVDAETTTTTSPPPLDNKELLGRKTSLLTTGKELGKVETAVTTASSDVAKLPFEHDPTDEATSSMMNREDENLIEGTSAVAQVIEDSCKREVSSGVETNFKIKSGLTEMIRQPDSVSSKIQDQANLFSTSVGSLNTHKPSSELETKYSKDSVCDVTATNEFHTSVTSFQLQATQVPNPEAELMELKSQVTEKSLETLETESESMMSQVGVESNVRGTLEVIPKETGTTAEDSQMGDHCNDSKLTEIGSVALDFVKGPLVEYQETREIEIKTRETTGIESESIPKDLQAEMINVTYTGMNETEAGKDSHSGKREESNVKDVAEVSAMEEEEQRMNNSVLPVPSESCDTTLDSHQNKSSSTSVTPVSSPNVLQGPTYVESIDALAQESDKNIQMSDSIVSISKCVGDLENGVETETSGTDRVLSVNPYKNIDSTNSSCSTSFYGIHPSTRSESEKSSNTSVKVVESLLFEGSLFSQQGSEEGSSGKVNKTGISDTLSDSLGGCPSISDVPVEIQMAPRVTSVDEESRELQKSHMLQTDEIQVSHQVFEHELITVKDVNEVSCVKDEEKKEIVQGMHSKNSIGNVIQETYNKLVDQNTFDSRQLSISSEMECYNKSFSKDENVSQIGASVPATCKSQKIDSPTEVVVNTDSSTPRRARRRHSPIRFPSSETAPVLENRTGGVLNALCMPNCDRFKTSVNRRFFSEFKQENNVLLPKGLDEKHSYLPEDFVEKPATLSFKTSKEDLQSADQLLSGKQETDKSISLSHCDVNQKCLASLSTDGNEIAKCQSETQSSNLDNLHSSHRPTESQKFSPHVSNDSIVEGTVDNSMHSDYSAFLSLTTTESTLSSVECDKQGTDASKNTGSLQAESMDSSESSLTDNIHHSKDSAPSCAALSIEETPDPISDEVPIVPEKDIRSEENKSESNLANFDCKDGFPETRDEISVTETPPTHCDDPIESNDIYGEEAIVTKRAESTEANENDSLSILASQRNNLTLTGVIEKEHGSLLNTSLHDIKKGLKTTEEDRVLNDSDAVGVSSDSSGVSHARASLSCLPTSFSSKSSHLSSDFLSNAHHCPNVPDTDSHNTFAVGNDKPVEVISDTIEGRNIHSQSHFNQTSSIKTPSPLAVDNVNQEIEASASDADLAKVSGEHGQSLTYSDIPEEISGDSTRSVIHSTDVTGTVGADAHTVLETQVSVPCEGHRAHENHFTSGEGSLVSEKDIAPTIGNIQTPLECPTSCVDKGHESQEEPLSSNDENIASAFENQQATISVSNGEMENPTPSVVEAMVQESLTSSNEGQAREKDFCIFVEQQAVEVHAPSIGEGQTDEKDSAPSVEGHEIVQKSAGFVVEGASPEDLKPSVSERQNVLDRPASSVADHQSQEDIAYSIADGPSTLESSRTPVDRSSICVESLLEMEHQNLTSDVDRKVNEEIVHTQTLACSPEVAVDPVKAISDSQESTDGKVENILEGQISLDEKVTLAQTVTNINLEDEKLKAPPSTSHNQSGIESNSYNFPSDKLSLLQSLNLMENVSRHPAADQEELQKVNIHSNKFSESAALNTQVTKEMPVKETDGVEQTNDTQNQSSLDDFSQTTGINKSLSPQKPETSSINANEGEGDKSQLLEMVEVKKEVCFSSEYMLHCSEDSRGDSLSCSYQVKGGVITILDDKIEDMTEPPIVEAMCPLCHEVLVVTLGEHIIAQHICVSFIPAKSTESYINHMTSRVSDSLGKIREVSEDEWAYVCRCCDFSSKDINAVRFHLNRHEDVYQVRTGRSTCECNQKVFSYQFHRWKSLLHSSEYYCKDCNYYFACENGYVTHLFALHCTQSICNICNENLSLEKVLDHFDLHHNNFDADEKDATFEPQRTTRSKGNFGLSWNIFDNSLNYLDGKDFRLSKVRDKTLDRSYLTLPIKNVLEEVTVPDKVKLDPAKDIRKYLQGKKDIKVTEEEINEILKNFNWFVQMYLEKKTCSNSNNSKKGKNSTSASKFKKENELFDALGIGTVKLPKISKKDQQSPVSTAKSLKTKEGDKVPDVPVEEDLEASILSRTRSGMLPTKEDFNFIDLDAMREAIALKSSLAVNGEWSKEHTYVCCSCGAGYLDLADIMDHKWEHHPAVWCAHTMFQGQDSLPLSFCLQFQPPTSQPSKVSLSTRMPQEGKAGPSKESKGTPTNSTSVTASVSKENSNSQMKCSRCDLGFSEISAFHSHLVECGGLNQMIFLKKKSKKGFRFKRRKGQGVPSNRYGLSSHPSTPLKAKGGDGSSGLNTPLLEKSQSSTIQSSGVKRRLELAIGSINNDELKNRLKAIITGSKKGSLSGALGIPGRRTIKMKLRKKGIDNRLLRKTRHSDKIKETKEKKAEETSKTLKSDEKASPNAKEEKSEGDNLPAKKGTQKKSNSADSGKDKKLKDSDEQSSKSEIVKSKSQKTSGKQLIGKKSSGVNADNTDVASVTAENTLSTAPKKKTKTTSQTSKKMSQEKSINGLIKVKKPKVVTDGKPSDSSSDDVKLIDVKKVLAKKIMDKKKKGVPNLLQGTASDDAIVNVESDNLLGNKEVSVQKKLKPPGKVKQCTTGQAKRNESSDVGALHHKKYTKKSKVITAIKNKKEFVKAKLASNKALNISNPLAKSSKPTKKTKVLPAVEENRTDTEISELVEAPTKSAQKKNLKVTHSKAKQDILTDKTKSSAKTNTSVPMPIIKKKKYIPPSSSEEVDDDSDDSEPEVIRNFRSGRSCSGRAGLRTKRRPLLSRYSFRTCLEPAKKENSDSTDFDEQVTDEHQLGQMKMETTFETEEFSDSEPISKKRKKKIANYENQDDCAYIPDEENSSDSEDDQYFMKASVLLKTKKALTRKKRKVSPLSNQAEHQEDLEESKPSDVETNLEGKDEGDMPVPLTENKGKKKVKYIKKKVIASKVSEKKIPVTKGRSSKIKAALALTTRGNTDAENISEVTLENHSESSIAVQPTPKSKGKKQKGKVIAAGNESEITLESNNDPRLTVQSGLKPKSKKYKGKVSASSVLEIIKKVKPKPSSKKKTKSVKDNEHVAETGEKKGLAKTGKSKLSKSQGKNMNDAKQIAQNTIKKATKKSVNSVKGKDKAKLNSQVILGKTQDLPTSENTDKKPQKIKGRSSSISLGNLSRADIVDKRGLRTIKKCSSMSSIPQNSKEELTADHAKNKVLTGKSRTLSDMNIASDSEVILALKDNCPTNSSIPQNPESCLSSEDKQSLPDSAPDVCVNVPQTEKKNKCVPKKKNKVPVLDSLDDKSSTSQHVSNTSNQTVKVSKVPTPKLTKSLKGAKKEKVPKLTRSKNAKKDTKKKKDSTELRPLDNVDAGENIGSSPAKKRGRKRKFGKLGVVEETNDTTMEEKELPSLLGTLPVEPVPMRGTAPGSKIMNKPKRKYTKKTSKSVVDSADVGSSNIALEEIKEESSPLTEISSPSVELKPASASKKRKLSVMEASDIEGVNPSGALVPSKKTKKQCTSIKGIANTDIPSGFKEKESSKGNPLLNNHVNKKIKTKSNRMKGDIKNAMNVKDDKENQSTLDVMPIGEPPKNPDLCDVNLSLNYSSGNEDASTPTSTRVKRRRSSVEKIKDIPTRSSANVNLQENPPPPFSDDTINEKISVNKDPDKVSEGNSSISAEPKIVEKPQIRKRRTQSSHEIRMKEELANEVNNEAIPVTSSSGRSCKNKSECHANTLPKKAVGRKRAASTSGLPKKDELDLPVSVPEILKGEERALGDKQKSSVPLPKQKKIENEHVDKAKKNPPKKKKKTAANNSKNTNDLKCLDCGLRFDSLASLEDHRQDCINIAFEMSLMEAEDHLFECQHCHLTFALKGTHRKHTASCRLGKTKRPLQKHEGKGCRRTSGRVLGNSHDTSIPVSDPVLGYCTLEEGQSKEQGINDGKELSKVDGDLVSTPVGDWVSCSNPGIHENVSKSKDTVERESVAGCSKSDIMQDLSPSKSLGSPKYRRRLRTNGKVEHSDVAEPVSTNIASEEKCVVCGCEIRDEDMSNKHLLLEQFAHSCQQQPVLEVCVLLAYYNLSMETIRSLAGSAIFYQGSTLLKLDAKQQTSPDLDPCLSTSENKSASQLLEILASPHCMWVSSVLEAIAQNYYTVEAVSISGTRQEALKAVKYLEDLFEEISNVDNTIRKNQMLRTMKETFEAGTL